MDVMKGKSLIQAELNLVLYVAAPVSTSLAWEGSAVGPQTRSHNCQTHKSREVP